ISPKLDRLSDCACFWHLADRRADRTNGRYLSKADEARFDVGRHIWTYRGSRRRSGHSRAHPPQRGGRLRKLEPAQKNKTLVCARLPYGARSYTGISFESSSEALIVPVLEGIWPVVFERKSPPVPVPKSITYLPIRQEVREGLKLLTLAL